MPETTIRSGRIKDLPDITDIYNHYVRESWITFDVEPFTVEQRRPWFDTFAEEGPYRLLVAPGDGRLRGFTFSHRFRRKPAYDTSVETSIYMHPDDRECGLGRSLYERLMGILEREQVHRA